TAFDTVLYVRDATCGGAELACNDDVGDSSQSRVMVSLTAGQRIFIVVDGFDDSTHGSFTLRVRMPSCPDSSILDTILPLTITASTSTAADSLSSGVCDAGDAPDREFSY